MDFKKHLDFVKDNLNLIIILPPLLGGLWQIIELSSISFSFIRFFSVTQMIPDGLLVLLILSIMSLSVYWIYFLFKTLKEKAEKETDKDEEPSLNVVNNKRQWKGVIYFAIYIGLIFLLVRVSSYFINNIEYTISIFGFLPVNILLSFLIFVSWHYFEENWVLDKKKRLKELDLLILLYILVEFMCFLYFIVAFHHAFMLPKELNNIQNLECKIKSVEPTLKMEILYANDKYIFVGHREPSKEKEGRTELTDIRIFKFEDLLDDNSCNEIEKRKLFVKDSIANLQNAKRIKDSIDKVKAIKENKIADSITNVNKQKVVK
ncbi:hypothetical protein LZZ90_08230 [Flavobacterium sp. SM15]|uniref:hypothetical protein n=1 Tax=Flavobacterium sp. SM15 TaxID=2908005 RepID=UPI001EDC3DDD|nr:hypothetical protein [Flavobacterium sp. SM15]MCG2611493.1 hypothetical protein [Flavobacterium sp. SM15]